MKVVSNQKHKDTFHLDCGQRTRIYILLDVCLPWAILFTLFTAFGLIF